MRKDVICFRQDHFDKQLIALQNAGGQAAQAYRKIAEIRQALELGTKPSCQGTSNGESRVKNAHKYDLANGYRLVTIDAGEVVIFCFAGTHGDTQKWLDKNRGIEPVISTRGRIGWVNSEVPNSALPQSREPARMATPLLECIDGLNSDKLFKKKSLRRLFEGFTLQTDPLEIQDFIDDIESDENQELAAHYRELIIACRNKDTEQAILIQELISGEAKAIAPESNPLTGKEVRDEINSDQLVVLSDLSEEEIQRLWDPTQFQEWMIYLHPSQARVVKEDYEKPAVLGGVSGSGKTCVLLHRAKRLAEEHPNENILILTLNRSLSQLIERLLELLVGHKPKNIRVESYHDYVYRLLTYVGMEEYFGDIGIVYDIDQEIQDFVNKALPEELMSFFKFRGNVEVRGLWDKFLADEHSGAKSVSARVLNYFRSRQEGLAAEDYLLEELDLIRSGFYFCRHEYKGYLDYKREGRAINLPTKDRKEDILAVLMAWERYQFKHGALDPMTISQAALWAIDQKESIPDALRYRSVLIDEYQDFSTEELRFISKIPNTKNNGLFLTGDPGQKIYAKDFNLPAAGLGPSDRTTRSILKNYRNSRQILEAAHMLLESYTNQSTAKSEGITILKPEYAVRNTAKPFALDTNEPILAAWEQASDWIHEGCPAFAVAIVTADEKNYPIKSIISRAPSKIHAKELSGDFTQDNNSVIVSDLQSVKGFEFSLVIVVGLANGEFPRTGKAEGEVWRDALKLYVAMTRARDELVLIYKEKPSNFIRLMKDSLFQKEIIYEEPIVADNVERVPPVEEEIEIRVSQNQLEEVSAPEIHDPLKPDEIALILKQPPINELTKPSHTSKQASDPEKDETVTEIAPPRAQTSSTSISSTINGFNSVRINCPATVRDVSKTMGKDVSIIIRTLQQWDEFKQPHDVLPEGYIVRLFRKLTGHNCIPVFVYPHNKQTMRNRHKRTTASETPSFTRYEITRCELDGCHNIATSGASLCYSHN
jgi:superfamily I DNA/RNA helicase